MLHAQAFSEQNVDSVIEDSPCLSEQKLPANLKASRSSEEPHLAVSPCLGIGTLKSTEEQPSCAKKKENRKT